MKEITNHELDIHHSLNNNKKSSVPINIETDTSKDVSRNHVAFHDSLREEPIMIFIK